MDPWTRTYTHTVDQRHLSLPPTWQGMTLTRSSRHESRERVFQSGPRRELAARIIAAIENAREVVTLSSFLLADKDVENALLTVARRGVRPYVLLATETRLDKEPRDDAEFDHRVLEEHKDMLKRLAGYVLIRSAPHFHAKTVLVDPQSLSGRGFLLTGNLTSEALERNEELGVELTRQEVQEVAALLKWAMWEQAEHELFEPGRLGSARPLGAVTRPAPGAHILSTTPESTDLRECVLRVIDGANKNLIVASFGWDANPSVVTPLCERAQKGIVVTVLARVRPAAMPALVHLAGAGVRVLGYRWLHAKAVLADNRQAVVMSANLEPHGLDQGFELGVLLDDKRVGELSDRLATWIEEAEWELKAAPTLGQLSGEVKIWEAGKFVEGHIEPSLSVSLPEVVAVSADALDATVPELPSLNGSSRLAQEVVCQRKVSAPRLALKANEARQKVEKKGSKSPDWVAYDLPVYREPSGRKVVAVRDPAQLERAQALLKEIGAAAIVVQENL